MATKTEIANMALGYVGDEMISDLDTAENNRARWCRVYFDTARRRALRLGRWSCATKRVTLDKDATAPDWGFTNRFKLPADFVRYVAVQDTGHDFTYEIEDGYFLTDLSSPIRMKYVFNLTDLAKFDPLLTTMFAYQLALDLVEKLNGSNVDKAELKADYKDWMAQAKIVNGTEAAPMEFAQQSWFDARSRGG